MKKIIITLLVTLMLTMTLVSASDKIINIPDHVDSFEEWKQMVISANGEKGYFSISTGDYFGTCSQDCLYYNFAGDCSTCASGEVASMCTWHPDAMSVLDTWSSASAYCNDWLKPYDYYNKQCYCKTPTVQCSGGADSGDRKCEGTEVWQCSNSGVWEYVSNCEYQCYSGTCQQQQCTDHTTKKCEGGSVYWFDSCGNKQEEYERCESDEVCQNAKCTRVCEEGFIGSTLCSGNKIVQQYQLSDCSTEIRDVDNCQFGCENSQCIEPQCSLTSPQPSAWSQCTNGEMSRTNYECNADTNYDYQSFTETESCECGTDGQCQYDETCESNVCVQLDCDDNEIADNHECIKKSSFSIWIIVGIVFGGIVVVIFLIIKMKGGRNKRR